MLQRHEDEIPEMFTKAPCPLNQLTDDNRLERVGFLLIPGFTYIGFACAIEPLRMANMVAAAPYFEALTISADGRAVTASNGVRTLPDYAIDSTPPVDVLFVCGPNPIDYPDERRLIHWLYKLKSQRVVLGGIDTGSYLLARAGLLDGYRCTIHWQDRESMLLAFPRVVVSDRIYEIDLDRLTSGGGTAAMDMMLHYMSTMDHSEHLAPAAADLLVHDRIRADRESQRVPLLQQLGTTQPKLRDAIALMEANIEEPIGLPELSAHTGLSKRQLERLFHDKIGCTPNAYYMQLRLKVARTRLLYSEKPISEIAYDCGFGSSSYFARRYRRLFRITPTQERSRNRAADRNTESEGATQP